MINEKAEILNTFTNTKDMLIAQCEKRYCRTLLLLTIYIVKELYAVGPNSESYFVYTTGFDFMAHTKN